MGYYSYITEACRRDAELHGMLHEIKKLAQKIEQDQTLMSLDRFPPPYLKKSLAARRVIMEERFVGSADIVVVFLAAFFRGDGDYDRFLAQEPVFLRGFRAERAPDDATLAAWVAERSEKPVEPLPEPSAVELGYLQPPAVGPQEGWMVYESRAWAERVARQDARQWLVSLSELIQELGLVSSAPPTGIQWLQHQTQPDVQIAYRVFPTAERILLLAPVLAGDARESVELTWLTGPLAELGPDASDEALLAVSARAYPDYITLDRDVWLATQESAGRANLALSPEEAALLRGMLTTDPGERRAYPLFINGRPGSGKSTILQYLFAEHLHFHLRQGPEDRAPYPPLYLTYSEPLLRRAREDVRSILRCDATKNASSNGRIEDRELDLLTDQAFGEFRVFLRQLLPEQKRREFDPQRLMDFLRFRQGWTQRAQRSSSPTVRRITPEMAWHVVRTYIKGMRQESADYIDPVWYGELPKKHRTVTEETFLDIYKHVWVDWYETLCAKDKWWDDQDLARAVLDLETLDISRYPAIFCDEAQDFTKVELELILRLSLFHRRMVPAFYLHRVPFAFAGDPFQTLNPTGFNWEAVRASFHDNIVTQLARAREARLEFNYQELAFNYRSNGGIVGIANLVQLVRGVVFDMPNLHPQKAWSAGASAAPVWFSTEDPETRTGLRENPDLVILIPCQEGEEAQWVANDPILKDIALEDGQVTRYVLSAVRAKGLEFPRVVLYGFGEACAREHPTLLGLLDGSQKKVADADACLPLQYFLNRLYVAVTRAQEQLVVVDTPRGINQFWVHARDGGPEALLARYGTTVWRHDDLIRLVDGTRDAWQQHRQEPEDLAKQFFAEAQAKNDAYLFTLAGANFRAAGDEPKARYCRALGLRAEGRLLDAGQELAGLGRGDEALGCYWTANAWKAIVALGEAASAIRGCREWDVAQALDGAPNPTTTLRLIELLQGDVLEPKQLDRMLADGRWGDVLTELVRRVADWPKDVLPERPNATAALSRLDSLERNGFPVPACVGLVRLAVLAGQPGRAVETWRALASPGPEPDWLLEALCENEPYPQRLLWLQKRQLHTEIIREYEGHKAERLSEGDAGLVFRAYVKAGRIPDAVEVVVSVGAESLVSEAFSAAMRAREGTSERRLAEWLLRQYVRTGRWSEAIALVTQRAVQRDRAGRVPLSDAVRKTDLEAALIKAVAASEHLATAPDATKRQIAALLRERLVEGRWANAAEVTLLIAALALERTGRFVEILPFYERLLDVGGEHRKEVARFARERWLVNKRRQLDVLTDDRSRRRALEEVHARSHEWRITLEGLSELPSEADACTSLRVRTLVDGTKRAQGEAPEPEILKHIPGAEGSGQRGGLRVPSIPGLTQSLDRIPAQVALGRDTHITAGVALAEPPEPPVIAPRLTSTPTPQPTPQVAMPAAADGRFVSFETVIRIADLDLAVAVDGPRHRMRIEHRVTKDTLSVYRVASGTNEHVRATDEGLTITAGDGERTYHVSPWGLTVRLIESEGDVVVRVSAAKGETFLIGL